MTLLKRNSRLFGDFEAELIDRHLHIAHRPVFGKAKAFKVDVACLAPEFPIESLPAKEWLLAAAISAAATALLIYLASQGIAPATTASLAALAALATIVTALVFRVRGARALVLATRHASYPLLRIRPIQKSHQDVTQFVEALLAKVMEAETKRSLSAENLRSGEVRTLRRLCNEAVITEAEYEASKQAVFNAAR